jgi:hypothetical protein
MKTLERNKVDRNIHSTRISYSVDLSDAKLLADFHSVCLGAARPLRCTLPATQALFKLQKAKHYTYQLSCGLVQCGMWRWP